MHDFNYMVQSAGALAEVQESRGSSIDGGYEWRETEHASFFPGRHADILVNGTKIGDFGIVHPEVLGSFDISSPVTALELNIELFCFDQSGAPLRTHAAF